MAKNTFLFGKKLSHAVKETGTQSRKINDSYKGKRAHSSSIGVSVSVIALLSSTALLSALPDIAYADKTFTPAQGQTDTVTDAFNDYNGSLIHDGPGTTILTTYNDYHGATDIKQGTLALSGDGSIAATSGLTMADGATFDISGTKSSGTSLNALNGAGTILLGDKTLSLANANADNSFAGTISGAGGLNLSNGTQHSLTLTGTNDYTGATNIINGSLSLSGSGSIANSGNVFVSTNGTFDISGATQPVTITNLNTNYQKDEKGHIIEGADPTINLGSNNLIITNADSIGKDGDSDQGVIAGTITGSGTVKVIGAIVTDPDNPDTINEHGKEVFGSGDHGTLTDQVSLDVGKTNVGVDLNGANTYTGTTTVENGGQLFVYGSTDGTSKVTIEDGGTLAGTGSIGAAGSTTTIEHGGTLTFNKVKASKLEIGGNLDMEGTSDFTNLSDSSDSGKGKEGSFVVGGNLTLNGTINTTDLSSSLGSGVQNLYTYNGDLTLGKNNRLLIDGVDKTDQLQTGQGRVNVVFTNGSDKLSFWDGSNSPSNNIIDGGDGVWKQNADDTTNWTSADGSKNASWQSGDFAIFQHNGGTVTVQGNVDVGGMQFDPSNGTNFTIAEGDAGKLILHGSQYASPPVADSTSSDDATSNGTKPDGTASNSTPSGDVTSNETTANGTSSSDAKPDASDSNNKIPYGTKPNEEYFGVTNQGSKEDAEKNGYLYNSSNLVSTIRVGNGTETGYTDNAVINATIADADGSPTTLVKTDKGSLTLGGQNTYRGGTVIADGSLAISDDHNLGAAGTELALNGGTLELTSDWNQGQPVNQGNETTRKIVLGNNKNIIQIDDGHTFTTNEDITGTGGVNYVIPASVAAGTSQNATLNLKHDSSYTGGTTISGYKTSYDDTDPSHYYFTVNVDTLNPFGASTADNHGGKVSFDGSNINMNAGSSLGYHDVSVSDSSVLFDGDNSTAGNATISLNDSDHFQFQNHGTAGAAHITLYDSSLLEFDTDADAGTSTIDIVTPNERKDASQVQFLGNSSAKEATINVYSGTSLLFKDYSKGGSAKLNTNYPNSRDTKIVFTDHSDAENASFFIKSGSHLYFKDNSNAGQSTIYLDGGDNAFFEDNSSADHVSMRGYGNVIFSGNTTANNAIIYDMHGQIDISKVTNPNGLSIGYIDTNSSIYLGGNTLTIGTLDTLPGNNTITSRDGTIRGTIWDDSQNGGTGGSIVKVGTGTETLTTENTYTGSTTVKDGTLALTDDGSIASSSLAIDSGAQFDVSGSKDGKAAVKSIEGEGNIFLGGSKLTLTDANSDKVYSGVISGDGGSLAITGGTQTLANNNTYTGDTFVGTGAGLNLTSSIQGTLTNEGTTDVNNGKAAGATTNTGTFTAENATLADIANNAGTAELKDGTTANTVTNAQGAAFTANSGTIAKVTNSGTMTLGSDDNGNHNEVTGDVTQSDGTLALNGNVIDGTLDAEGGNFTVSAAGAQAGSLSGSAGGELDGTLTLNNASGTYSGVMDGNGGLTVAGGTETLTGTNSYKGDTTVKADGGLNLTGANAALAGTLNNAGTTTLTSGTIAGVTTNSGTFTAHGGTLTTADNSGHMTLDTDANGTGNQVTGDVTNHDGADLTLNGDSITGKLDNAGTVTADHATLSDIDNHASTTEQLSNATLTDTTAGTVINDKGATFTAHGGTITNAENSGTMTLDADASGTGNQVTGNVTNHDGATLTLNSDNITGELDNAGTVNADHATLETLDNHAGSTDESSQVIMTDSNVYQLTNDKGATFTAHGGTNEVITNSGSMTLDTGNYASDVTNKNSGELTLNNATINETLYNDGGTFTVEKDGATAASLKGSGNGTLIGTLTLNGVTDTYSGSLSGTGGLTISGETKTQSPDERLLHYAGGDTPTEIETLTGTNSYKGETKVSGKAELDVNGDNSGATGQTTITNGGTLRGTGTIGGDVTVNDSSILAAGTADSTGTLKIKGNLTLGENSTQRFRLGQANVAGGQNSDYVTVGGNLNLAGNIVLEVNNNDRSTTNNELGIGLYHLYGYKGKLDLNSSTSLSMGSGYTTQDGKDPTLQTAIQGQVNAIVGGDKLTFWDGDDTSHRTDDGSGNGKIDGGSGTWTAPEVSKTNNWTSEDGIPNAPWVSGNTAIFSGDAGTVTVQDNPDAHVYFSKLQFANTDGKTYVIKGDKLYATQADTVIQVGASAPGTSGSDVDKNTTAEIDSVIDGSLVEGGTGTALHKTDAGKLILTSDNDFAQGTQIDGGTVQLGNGGTTGSVGDHDIADNGTLVIDHSNDVTLNQVISGNGSFIQQGTGTTTLAGNNTYTGDTDVTGGTLNVTGTIAGNLNNATTTTVTDGTIGGKVTNSGTFTADGATIASADNGGTMTLGTDTNGKGTSVTGDVTNKDGGDLKLDEATISGNLDAEGGNFTVSPAGAQAGSLFGSANGALDGTLTLNNASGTYTGAMDGKGGLTVSKGTETLTGNNSYTGDTTVSADGGLNLNGSNAALAGALLNAGKSDVNGGTVKGDTTNSGTFTAENATLADLNNHVGTATLASNVTLTDGTAGTVTNDKDATFTANGTTIAKADNSGSMTLGTDTNGIGTSVTGDVTNHQGAHLTLDGNSITGKLDNSGNVDAENATLSDIANHAGTATLASNVTLTDGSAGTVTNDKDATLTANGTTIAKADNSGSMILGTDTNGIGTSVTGDVANHQDAHLTLNGNSITGKLDNSGNVDAENATLADIDNHAGTATLASNVTLTDGTAGTVTNDKDATFTAHGTTIAKADNSGSMTLGTDTNGKGTSVTGDVTNHDGGDLKLDGATIGGNLDAEGGKFTVSAAGAQAGSLSGSANGALDGTLTLNNASGSYSGAMDGKGGLTVSKGTETLTGNNSYTGDTTVSADAGLNLNGSSAALAGALLNAGKSDVNGGTVKGDTTNSGTFTAENATLADLNNHTGTTTLASNVSLTDGTAGTVTNDKGATFTANGTTIAKADNSGSMTLGTNKDGKGTNVTGDVTNHDGGDLKLDGATIGGDLDAQGGNFTVSPAGAQAGSLSGSAGGTLDGTLTLNNASGTYSGAMDGKGGLTVSKGTETLTGKNSYTGNTSVGQNATLIVSGDNSAAKGDTSVDGTLRGNGTIGGNVTINDGGTLAAGTNDATGTLTIGGDLTLDKNSTQDFRLGEANVSGGRYNDYVNVSGNLNLAGNIVLHSNAASSSVTGGTLGAGVYHLYGYGKELHQDASTTLSVDGSNKGILQTSIDHQVNVVVGGDKLTFWDGDNNSGNGKIDGGNGTWSAPEVSTTNNWTTEDGTINAPWTSGNSVIFSGNAGTVTVQGSPDAHVSFSNIQFANTDGKTYVIKGDKLYATNADTVIQVGASAPGTTGSDVDKNTTAEIDSVIDGSNVEGGIALHKTDAGKLILTSDNDFAQGTKIDGGTLQLGNGSTTGSVGDHDIADNGTLVIDHSNDVTLNQVISGNGSFIQQGTGTTTLAGNNTYTGDTDVTSGTLNVTGSIAGNLNNATTTTVTDGTIGGKVTNNGTFTADGATIAGADNSGTMTLGTDTNGKGTSVTGDVTNHQDAHLTLDGSSITGKLDNSGNVDAENATLADIANHAGTATLASNVTLTDGTAGTVTNDKDATFTANGTTIAKADNSGSMTLGTDTNGIGTSVTGDVTNHQGAHLTLDGNSITGKLDNSGNVDAENATLADIANHAGTATLASNVTLTDGSAGTVTNDKDATFTVNGTTIAKADNSGTMTLGTDTNGIGTSVTGDVTNHQDAHLTLDGNSITGKLDNSGNVDAENATLSDIANHAGTATLASNVTLTDGTAGTVSNDKDATFTANGTTIAKADNSGSMTLGTDKDGNVSQVTGDVTNHDGGDLKLDGAIIGGNLDAEGGKFTVSAASSDVSQAGSLSGSANGTLDETLALNNASGTYTGAMDGKGGLMVSGGTETLTGNNTYTGDTTVRTDAKLILEGSISSVLSNDGTTDINGGTVSGMTTNFGTVTAENATLGQVGNYAGHSFTATGGTIESIDNVGTMHLKGGNTVTTDVYNQTGGDLTLDGDTIKGTLTEDHGNFTVSDKGASVGSLSDGVDKNTGEPTTGDGKLEGTLTLTNASGTYSGSMSGNGGLTVSGGTETLTGKNSYQGETIVGGKDGTKAELIVNGDNSAAKGDTSVDGTLRGNGTIGGNVTLNKGGTLAVGTSDADKAVDTIHINGDLTTSKDSVVRIRGTADKTGNKLTEADHYSPNELSSDHILVGGKANLNGGTLDLHVSDPSKLTYGEAYHVLNATNGVSGQYDTLNTNLGAQYAYLDPTLVYHTNDIDIVLSRGKQNFGSAGHTRNQIETGHGLDHLEYIASDNPVITAVTGLTKDQAPRALDSLSGEVHASIRTALIQDSFFIRNAALNRLANSDCDYTGEGQSTYDMKTGKKNDACSSEHTIMWGQAYGSIGHNSATGNAATMHDRTTGFIMGVDTPIRNSNWRVGGLFSYGHSMFNISQGRSSSGNSNNVTVGGYAGTHWGRLNLRLGVAYSWNVINARRDVIVGAYNHKITSHYLGGTAQSFAELGYKMHQWHSVFEPFMNVAYVNMQTNGYREHNGDAALRGRGTDTGVTFATFGMRASTRFNIGKMIFMPHFMAAYRHAFGELEAHQHEAFALTGGNNDMEIAGSKLSSNAAIIDTGISARLTDTMALDLSYIGQYGDHSTESGATGSLKINF